MVGFAYAATLLAAAGWIWAATARLTGAAVPDVLLWAGGIAFVIAFVLGLIAIDWTARPGGLMMLEHAVFPLALGWIPWIGPLALIAPSVRLLRGKLGGWLLGYSGREDSSEGGPYEQVEPRALRGSGRPLGLLYVLCGLCWHVALAVGSWQAR